MKNAEKHINAPIIQSCLVMPKGATKGLMGGAVVGAAGSAVKAALDTATDKRGTAASPLAGGTGTLGLLALTDDEIVLLDGHRGMVRPVADKVVSRVARTRLAAVEIGKGKLSSPIELTWNDGSSWVLEVPRQQVKHARALVEQAGF
jgi:hypothetical protein